MEICIFNHYNLATGSMAACFPFFILNFYTQPILWYYIDAILRLTFMLFSFFHYITWMVSNIIGKLFLNLKASGKENLKNLDSGGALFVANHQGRFDPFLIGASIPFFYFSKIKCFRYQTYYKFITERWYGLFIC